MRFAILLIGTLIFAGQGFAENGDDPGELVGQKMYDALCNVCHGKYGRGDGPAATYLKVAPPDFTLPATLESKSDDEIMSHLVLIPEESDTRHIAMVTGDLLDDEELRAALAYIRSMAVRGRHVSVSAGQDLYNGICWICHGIKGDGAAPAAMKLGETKARDFTSTEFKIDGREDEIYRVIATGAEETIHGSKYMIEWSTKLTPQQINDIIEYLRTF